MQGGEIFVPKIPSMKITDLTEAIAPQCEVRFDGIRPGEKIHESLLSSDEARHALEFDDMFVIMPRFLGWDKSGWKDGKAVPDEFVYNSDTNPAWLSKEELRRMADVTETP
jgi:UDP-N-acetylglucosamine 4,6-dehydratase